MHVTLFDAKWWLLIVVVTVQVVVVVMLFIHHDIGGNGVAGKSLVSLETREDWR